MIQITSAPELVSYTAVVLKKPMTLADSAWLHLERPENLMMVVGLLLLDRNPDHDRLETILTERLLPLERFRMRAVEPAGGVGHPHWEEDPAFDLSRHLHYCSLPAADERALLGKASALMSQPLPRDRPLWDFCVFEDIQDGAAVLVRLHHAIADGIALMRVLLNVAEPLDQPEAEPVFTKERSENVAGAWDTASRWAHEWLRESHDLLFHPGRAADLMRQGWETGKVLRRVLALSPDTDNALRGDLAIRKASVVSAPLPLCDLKAAGKRLNCTVNDLLMAALAGALGRYLRRVQEVDSTLQLRMVVPVDLRAGSLEDLGNRFGLVFLTLPVGEPGASERLRRTRANMRELKRSPEALVTYELLNAVGALPARLEQSIVKWFGDKATAVVASLRGPEQALCLGAARLTGLMYWVPQSGQLSLGVSMLSYAGSLRVGITGDAAILSQPDLLLEDFLVAYRETLEAEAPCD